MFIVNPTKGGYQGDVVNAGFRRGRQDAYRDYIDNYNFALQSDAATNAANQLNVEQTAKNYGLQNQMRQGARTEAINFVNDNSKLDDAIVGNEINRYKNDYVWAKAPELGESQGVQFVATQSANEGKARGDAAVMVDYGRDPQDFINSNHEKAKAAGLQNNATRANTAYTNANTQGKLHDNANAKARQTAAQALATAQNLASDYGVKVDEAKAALDEAMNTPDATWQKMVVDSMVKEAQRKGDARSVAEIVAEVQNDPNFVRKVKAYQQAVIAKSEQDYNKALVEHNTRLKDAEKAEINFAATQNGATHTGKGSSNKTESIKESNLKFDKDDEYAFSNYVKQSNGKFLNDDKTIALVGRTVVFPSGLTRAYPPNYTEKDIRKAEGLPPEEETDATGNANQGNLMGG